MGWVYLYLKDIMKRFVITEEERRHIKNLYEQLTNTSGTTTNKDSDEYCEVSVGTEVPSNVVNRWNQMNPDEKKKKISEISPKLDAAVKKARDEYEAWFKNPDTSKKFPSLFDKTKLMTVSSYIQTIKKINLIFNLPKDKNPGTMGWVSSNEPTVININVPKFHDGDSFTNSDVYQTIKHEMAHLIDNYLTKIGVKTYNQTVDTSTQELYDKNYIINDKDQYARLNLLRSTIGAAPMDGAKELLTKFMNKVKENVITFPKLDVSVSKSTQSSQKNNTDLSNAYYSWIEQNGGIFVNNSPIHNFSQLFGTFAARGSGNSVLINFNLIADLNITSAKANTKSQDTTGSSDLTEETEEVLYLKLTPKQQ